MNGTVHISVSSTKPVTGAPRSPSRGKSSSGGRSACTAAGTSRPAESAPASLDSNVAGALESRLEAALLADGKKASCMQLHAQTAAIMHGTNTLRLWLREHLDDFMGDRPTKASTGI
eukprot:1855443-Amphidinium_carterae.1